MFADAMLIKGTALPTLIGFYGWILYIYFLNTRVLQLGLPFLGEGNFIFRLSYLTDIAGITVKEG